MERRRSGTIVAAALELTASFMPVAVPCADVTLAATDLPEGLA